MGDHQRISAVVCLVPFWLFFCLFSASFRTLGEVILVLAQCLCNVQAALQIVILRAGRLSLYFATCNLFEDTVRAPPGSHFLLCLCTISPVIHLVLSRYPKLSLAFQLCKSGSFFRLRSVSVYAAMTEWCSYEIVIPLLPRLLLLLSPSL